MLVTNQRKIRLVNGNLLDRTLLWGKAARGPLNSGDRVSPPRKGILGGVPSNLRPSGVVEGRCKDDSTNSSFFQ